MVDITILPYSERSLVIFLYQKHYQFDKTIRLSTHMDIFDKKKFSKFFFGMGGQKVEKFFLI